MFLRFPVTIRQVRFPDGRYGLEVETIYPAMGGSEPGYSYYADGSRYRAPEGVKRDWYGRIEGIRVFDRKPIELNVEDVACRMSVDYSTPPGPDDVPRPY